MSEVEELLAQLDALFAERRFADAIPYAQRWTEVSPTDWRAYADLVVALKHARDFAGCRSAALRAIDVGVPAGETGLHWNAGIAATALGDWSLARRSWAACGLDVPGVEGPIDWPLGAVPIRVGGPDAREVVWCSRICPARAIIRSIPLPESGRRCGDLVLHDGEPRGKRLLHGQEVSVFDELALLEGSPFATYTIVLEAPTQDDVGALRDALLGTCEAIEDWTESLEYVCKSCSEGLPHAEHDAPPREWRLERRVAIAGRDSPSDALLRAWAQAAPGRQIVEVRAPRDDGR